MSKRTRVLLLGMVGAWLGMTALPWTVRPAPATELKLAHFTSPKHPMHQHVFQPWADEVSRLTNQGLTVRIYPGGALGKSPEHQYQRVIDGIADIAWGLQGYTSKQFPRTLLVELPGLAHDTVGATKMLWHGFDLIKEEYSRTKVLGLWTSDQLILMTRTKPVRTLEDLRGLKIRIPSKPVGTVVAALGGTPVSIPGPAMYHALSTGTVDGVVSGASVIQSINLGEVARHYTLSPFSHTAMFLVMNIKSYDSLPTAHKAVIDKTTGLKLSLKAAEAYENAATAALEHEAKSGRGEIIRLSVAETKRWLDVMGKARQGDVIELEKQGIPAGKIVKAFESTM